MINVKYCVLLVFCIYSFVFYTSPANAEENIDPQGILAIAKIAGACGIMDEMIDFQKKTQLEGGNEFVTRFWHAESARRGMTVEETSEQCNQAIVTYDKLWTSMDNTGE